MKASGWRQPTCPPWLDCSRLLISRRRRKNCLGRGIPRDEKMWRKVTPRIVCSRWLVRPFWTISDVCSGKLKSDDASDRWQMFTCSLDDWFMLDVIFFIRRKQVIAFCSWYPNGFEGLQQTDRGPWWKREREPEVDLRKHDAGWPGVENVKSHDANTYNLLNFTLIDEEACENKACTAVACSRSCVVNSAEFVSFPLTSIRFETWLRSNTYRLYV